MRCSPKSAWRAPGGGGVSGGPAKHWAFAIHCAATGPVTPRSVSATFRVWATTWAKATAGPSMRFSPSSSPYSPDRAGRGGELQVRHRPRRLALAHRPGPAVGVDPEHDHVADPVVLLALESKEVEDRLPVGPRLHEAGGDRGARGHVRPDPGDAPAGVYRYPALRHCPVEAAASCRGGPVHRGRRPSPPPPPGGHPRPPSRGSAAGGLGTRRGPSGRRPPPGSRSGGGG